jgi:hypothetical protein
MTSTQSKSVKNDIEQVEFGHLDLFCILEKAVMEKWKNTGVSMIMNNDNKSHQLFSPPLHSYLCFFSFL